MPSEKADPTSTLLLADEVNPPSQDPVASNAVTANGSAEGEEGQAEQSKSAGKTVPKAAYQRRSRITAKKEAKRLEKLARAAAKTVVPSASTSTAPKKEKKEKAAKTEAGSLEEWVNPTPAGEKKGGLSPSYPFKV